MDVSSTYVPSSTISYNSPGKNHTHSFGVSFAIAMIFLVIALALLVLTVIYFLFWKPVTPSPSCATNLDCSNGQICQLGVCAELSCNSDSDCPNNASCIQSYCYPLTCNTGNDCPAGSACISGTCFNTGTPCSSNATCFHLTCANSVCVQCLSNSDCPIGQGCFSNSCRYPYDGETGPNMITFLSPAQANGNVTAPPAYFCPASNCGTGQHPHPIPCTSPGQSCPSSCQYCVNNYCRCTQGQLYESCRSNSDCVSGLCSDTEIGTICVPSGGECAFNYNGTGCQGCCSPSNPYCVNGKCSNVSLGAICGSKSLPPDMCNNPLSLGSSGTTGITDNGMGFFCVNGTCQNDPGPLNSLCAGDSCAFIYNNSLVCSPVSTPDIIHMRCLSL